MPFFSGEKMTGGYGGADIISSCTINVDRGEIVAILGPNGAGKSTAMKAMLGLLNLKSGKVSIDGRDISKLTPQDRVREGISFVPQNRNVFTGLSVQENLEMGAYLREERIEEIIAKRRELIMGIIAQIMEFMPKVTDVIAKTREFIKDITIFWEELYL